MEDQKRPERPLWRENILMALVIGAVAVAIIWFTR
jgi:hypothetical protein